MAAQGADTLTSLEPCAKANKQVLMIRGILNSLSTLALASVITFLQCAWSMINYFPYLFLNAHLLIFVSI